jgi:hypothetical protein
MSQLVNKAKAWNTPIGFMLSIFIVSCLQSLATLQVTRQVTTIEITGTVFFNMLFWPSLILAESIIYWVIRKRIKERKWVWAHLLFSLFAFVLLTILRIAVSFLAITHNLDGGRASIRLMNTIQNYCFWGSIIIGHVFFVVAIVRTYSGNSPQLPHDDNDLLSEFAG